MNSLSRLDSSRLCARHRRSPAAARAQRAADRAGKGAPDVAVVQFRSTLGPLHLRYHEHVHGQAIQYEPKGIPLPNRCPRDGFRFAASFALPRRQPRQGHDRRAMSACSPRARSSAWSASNPTSSPSKSRSRPLTPPESAPSRPGLRRPRVAAADWLFRDREAERDWCRALACRVARGDD
jgi:hypothetical protein